MEHGVGMQRMLNFPGSAKEAFLTTGVVSAGTFAFEETLRPHTPPSARDARTSRVRVDVGAGAWVSPQRDLSPRSQLGIKVGLALISWAFVGCLVALAVRLIG